MIIEIDSNSGFCNGVVRAIRMAEEQLSKTGQLYCLGDIVHNGSEVERLAKCGLATVDIDVYNTLNDTDVLLRAHGEPPSTYQRAKLNNINIIDATCPVVLKLQQRIKKAYNDHRDMQLVIFGKHGHAEVLGLVGQTSGNAIVVQDEDDLNKIDYSRGIILFSQTTKSVEHFKHIIEQVRQRLKPGVPFQYFDTICRQVANRLPNIRTFASQFDIVLFVGDVKSSNGKMLFEECQKVNEHVHFISHTEEINLEWFDEADSVGICGATSTPKWLMEEIAQFLKEKIK